MTTVTATDPTEKTVSCRGNGGRTCRGKQLTNMISLMTQDGNSLESIRGDQEERRNHYLTYFDGGIVSYSSEEEDESKIAPLDFRVDWSTQTEYASEWQEAISFSPEPRIEEYPEKGTYSMDWELDSALSCEYLSDLDNDSDQYNDIWEDNKDSKSSSTLASTITIARPNGTETRTDGILDCRWVEPEYPEVWRVHP